MTTPDSQRTAAIEAFYREPRDRLERRVAARVSGLSPDLIEEACQYAWAVLLRRPDIRLTHDGRGLGWLVVVVTQEAWRAAHPKDVPTGAYALAGDRGVIAEPGAHPSPALDDQIVGRELHQQRVGYLAQLKPAERQALAYQALGYSYREIGQLTGASYTAVILGRDCRRRSRARFGRRRHVLDGRVAASGSGRAVALCFLDLAA